MEQIIMQSQKINKDKTMRNLWLSLGALLIVSVLVMAIAYIPVKKAQDVIIDGLLAFTDDYAEYSHSRKEMLEEMEYRFDMGSSSYKIKDAYDMYGALVNLYGAEEDMADALLEMAGYDNKTAYRWVSYGTFGQYYFQEGIFFVVIILLLSIALGTTNLLYLKDKKTELSILENAVIGKKSNGKTVQFLLKDIKSVETTKKHGLKITGAGINYDIHLIENAEEMKNVMMDMLAKVQNEKSVVAVAGSSANDIKEYKELLDAGIITQEEFDAKKKQLLGL